MLENNVAFSIFSEGDSIDDENKSEKEALENEYIDASNTYLVDQKDVTTL